MNVKRFKKISKILSIVLYIFAILIGLATLFSIYLLFSKNKHGLEFVFRNPNLIILQMGPLSKAEDLAIIGEKVSFYILPLILLVFLYALLKGGRMFKDLSSGETPFNTKFARDLKRIGLLILFSDIALPILYSAIYTLISRGSYHIVLGISHYFFFGLFLYIGSEILNYGISLQELADETV